MSNSEQGAYEAGRPWWDFGLAGQADLVVVGKRVDSMSFRVFRKVLRGVRRGLVVVCLRDPVLGTPPPPLSSPMLIVLIVLVVCLPATGARD